MHVAIVPAEPSSPRSSPTDLLPSWRSAGGQRFSESRPGFTRLQSLFCAGERELIGARHEGMALLCAQPSASEVSLSEPPKLPDPSENAAAPISSALVADVRALVNAARHRAAEAINAELVLLYWGIGNRIRRDILGEERAGYGEQIVSTLSRQLTSDYGAGFSRPNLFHMMRFVDVWPDRTQVEIMAPQLGWSHFKELLYLESEIQRQFYAEMCRVERWSVRTLRERVRGMLFERTAISRKPEEVARQELQKLELGTDFAFIARQKRMTIGNQDFYLDLLFYHRRLRRLIAIELKLGRFEATYKGQMELYLRWLDKYERRSETRKPQLGSYSAAARIMNKSICSNSPRERSA